MTTPRNQTNPRVQHPAVYAGRKPKQPTKEEQPMSTALATRETSLPAEVIQAPAWESKLDLLKRTIAPDTDDDQFELFLLRARQTGLDPFAGQIMPIMRYDHKSQGQVMTIQVGIHGLRLIADRTGRYCPGKPTVYQYDDQGKLVSATAYVMKLVGEQWHEIGETAFWEEYAQSYTAKESKERKLTPMWAEKPRLMLSKCAESLALRRAFPAETMSLYTEDEMGRGDVIDVTAREVLRCTEAQVNEIYDLCERAGQDSTKLRAKLKVDAFTQLDETKAEQVIAWLNEKLKKAEASASEAPA